MGFWSTWDMKDWLVSGGAILLALIPDPLPVVDELLLLGYVGYKMWKGK